MTIARLGYRSIAAFIGIVTILVALVGTWLILRPAQSAAQQSRPAPQNFSWSPGATIGSKTVQDAFSAGMKLTPCLDSPGASDREGAPARSSTISWLFAGPKYGLARIQVTCENQARPYSLWLLSFVHDSNGMWRPESGAVSDFGKNPNAPKSVVPLWLHLPDDTYFIGGLPNSAPTLQPGSLAQASVVAWYSKSHLFVFGHVADSETQPSGATPVQVDGHAGWSVRQNDLTTVTVLLSDGTTAFLSGTGPSSQVKDLASSATAHMDEILSPLPS